MASVAHHHWLTALKVLVWTTMALSLLAIGLLVGTINVLTPQRLTPIVLDVANRVLNADVSVTSVELSFRKSYPYLDLAVTDVKVISRDIKSLEKEVREHFPIWADTVFTADTIRGGINLLRLVRHIVDLHDLQVIGPQLSLLIINDSLNNFSILRPTLPDTVDTAKRVIPDVRINSFDLVRPHPLRYADVSQDVRACLAIESADLTDPEEGREAIPHYHINFNSDVSSPILNVIGRNTADIGMDGVLIWQHDKPMDLSLQDFTFKILNVSGKVDASLNFDSKLTINSLDFNFAPTSVAEILAMVPDSIAKAYYIPTDIVTDAVVTLQGSLSKPYVAGSAQLPLAELRIVIPPCSVRYDRLALDRLEFDSDVSLCGGTLNDIKLDIHKLTMEGPATRLDISGHLTEIATDPLFDGQIDGQVDVTNVPRAWLSSLRATIKGKVDAQAAVLLRPSMFTRSGFHRLQAQGRVSVDGLYYLAHDTLSMYYAHRLNVEFGANQWIKQSNDSLLRAKVDIDSAAILVSGLDIRANNLTLGIGALDQNATSDTTWVIPVGGRIHADQFSLISITDSASFEIDKLGGRLAMLRYHDDTHLPLFKANLDLETISAGNNKTRFVVNEAHLNCNLAKVNVHSVVPKGMKLKHAIDTLPQIKPDISRDSVYILARAIRERNRRPGHHHVYPVTMPNGTEVIEWETKRGLHQLLLDWEISGSLTGARSRLLSPTLSLVNEGAHLDVCFNNDTLSINNLDYKIGRSDFLLSGNISNIKGVFGYSDSHAPLFVNFDIGSHFIDANQLSEALHPSKRSRDDADATRGAFILPINIDAQIALRSQTVEYSDFVISDVRTIMLMYDGAVSIHDMTARSDVGQMSLNALYAASKPDRMGFGLALELKDFDIRRFLKLAPEIDSLAPVLRDMSGFVTANLAMGAKIDSAMDIEKPTLKAALTLSGDSLTIINPETFDKIAHWLCFKDKNRNIINHLSVDAVIDGGQMRVYPFVFDFDRYRLGIRGHNDLDLNFNYHVAVLKSPIPIKFGVNLSGRFGHLKVRLGGADFKEGDCRSYYPDVESVRQGLLHQFDNIYYKGLSDANFPGIDLKCLPCIEDYNLQPSELTPEDSLCLHRYGIPLN